MKIDDFELAMISVKKDGKYLDLKFVTDAMVQVEIGFAAEYRIRISRDSNESLNEIETAGRSELQNRLNQSHPD